MKKITTIIILFFLFSCNSTGINWLDKKIVDYRSLPKEVKNWIFTVNFKDLNEPNKYYLERRQNKIFPWIYYNDIRREKDNKIFDTELNGEFGNHYIIYKDFLFVPNHYNIQKSDSLKYSFTRFKLE